jgi:phosphoglycolate phosphatase
MQLAAVDAGLEVPSDAAVRHIIGISLLPAIAQLFAISFEHAEEVAKHYKRIFIEKDQTPSPLFDGAADTLTQLQQNYVLGVATGKARRGLERAWEHTQTAHYFTHSRCADEAESKPSPDMLIQLLDEWKVDAKNVLMVGDTIYDMQMAKAINMPRLAVSYGVHHHDLLRNHEPVAVIDRFSDILKHV